MTQISDQPDSLLPNSRLQAMKGLLNPPVKSIQPTQKFRTFINNMIKTINSNRKEKEA